MGFLTKLRKRAASNNNLGLRKKSTSKGRSSGGFLKRARADAARGKNSTSYKGGGGGFLSAMRRRRRGSGISGLLSKVANRVNQQPEVVEQTKSYFNPATGMASEAAEYTAPNPVMDYIKQAQARGESPSQQGIQNFRQRRRAASLKPTTAARLLRSLSSSNKIPCRRKCSRFKIA
jgi:hypothetical protein